NEPPVVTAAPEPLISQATSLADEAAEAAVVIKNEQPGPVVTTPDTLQTEVVSDESSDWYMLVQACELGGIGGNILWNCDLHAIEGNSYQLILDETQSALFSADHPSMIAEALSTVRQQPIELSIRIG